jgi:predicted nucleic acid-binding protein
VIVVDTNLIVYLLVKGDHTEQATKAFRRDPAWAAPRLWRSEFRNVLAVYMQRGSLALNDALQIVQAAQLVMQGREYEPSSTHVLSLAAGSRCSAYDCEFVAVAKDLVLPLVTLDRRVLAAFPATAVYLHDFAT